ncbi:MAG TPA: hypothetical protein VMZ26_15245 [Pyrinomonadaceae bacterium]|nr:hypothetical protein [Pyrinomonadaceae bacterium]
MLRPYIVNRSAWIAELDRGRRADAALCLHRQKCSQDAAGHQTPTRRGPVRKKAFGPMSGIGEGVDFPSQVYDRSGVPA